MTLGGYLAAGVCVGGVDSAGQSPGGGDKLIPIGDREPRWAVNGEESREGGHQG